MLSYRLSGSPKRSAGSDIAVNSGPLAGKPGATAPLGPGHRAATGGEVDGHMVTGIVPPLETRSADEILPIRFNLRDLGGVETADGRRVAGGRFYRGASLHRLEEEHLAVLAGFGIKTAIDLRTSGELEHGIFAGDGATVHHLPVFEVGIELGDPGEEPAQTLVDAYLWMLDEGPAAIRASIDLLGDPESVPAVVYCAAGKDRTGLICATVLTLLGVDRETIATDYALSDAPATALREWILDQGADPTKIAAAGIFRAPREAMELFLAAVDERFGSLEGYLAGIGVDVEDARRRLAANLLADA
jgi:protein-tyrosine phosphatase